MWSVTNKAKDVRKFWDGDKGCDIFVNPGVTTFTMRPPEESDVWKVEETKEKKSKKEVG